MKELETHLILESLRTHYSSYLPSTEEHLLNMNDPYTNGLLDFIKEDPAFIKDEIKRLYPQFSKNISLKSRVALASYYSEVFQNAFADKALNAQAAGDLVYFHDIYYGASLVFGSLFMGEDLRINEGKELTRTMESIGEINEDLVSVLRNNQRERSFTEVASLLAEDRTGKTVAVLLANMTRLNADKLPSFVIPEYVQKGADFAADAYAFLYDYTANLIEGIE